MRQDGNHSGAATDVLVDDDVWSSATVRDLRPLDDLLTLIERRAGAKKPRNLIDLGCGIGGTTLYAARRLKLGSAVGVELVDHLARRAAGRGVHVVRSDLNRDALPFRSSTFDVALSLGTFEHLLLYDNAVAEASRVLRDGGWLIVGMPNLASYVNRLALLLGYQPHTVEVSKRVAAGMLPQYQKRWRDGLPEGVEDLKPAHIHAATLRCMRELLAAAGFRVVEVRGLSPRSSRPALTLLDTVFGRLPSWSRRFIILAERVTAAGS